MDFIIEKHGKRDLVSGFQMAEIYIARIIHGAHHILHTLGNFKNALIGECRIGDFVKRYVFVSFMASFIYVADKFIWLQRKGVNIRFILVSYLKKIVIETVGFPIANNMINRFAIYLIEGGCKNGFTRTNIDSGQF